MRPSDRELIAKLPLFEKLPPELVDRLVRGAFVQGLPKGAILTTQGDEAEFLHIILSGRVGLLGEATNQRETVVEFFQTGDVFIAPALILKARYLMTARVIDDARILMIPAEIFRRLLESEHALAYSMTLVLAGHWRLLVRQIKELKLKSAGQRLGSYLLAMTGTRTGSAAVRLPEERQLVAARLGMTPESLSRSFALLRPVGVTGRGKQVQIADVGRLREFCQEDDLR